MLYLIAQVLQILLIATFLGFLLGWILRKWKATRVEEELKTRLHQSEETIKPIKQALSQAQSEVEGRDNSIANLQVKLKDLDGEIPPLKAEVQKLASKLTDNSVNVDGLKKAVNDKDNLLLKLGNDLNHEKASVRQVDQALADAHGKRAELEQRLAEMRVKLENNTAATERAREGGANLQKEINALQISLNDSLHKKDAAIANLRRDLDQESKEHGKVAEALAQAEAQKVQSLAKIDALRQDLQDKITDQKVATAKGEALQREIDSLQAQLSRLQQTHDHKVSELEAALERRQQITDDANKKLSENAGLIAKSEGEIDRLKDKLALFSNQHNDSETVQNKLKKEIADLRKGTETLKLASEQNANKLERQLDQSSAKIAGLEKDLASSEKQLTAFASDRDKALAQLATNKNATGKSEKDQSRLEQKIAILEAKIKTQEKDAQSRVADLEKRLAHSDKDRITGDKNQQQLEQKIQDLKEDLNGKVTDIKIASTQRENLTKDISSLEGEVADLSDQAKSLQTALANSKAEHQKKISELREALAVKETRAASGGIAITKLAELKEEQKANDKAQLQAMKQAEQKIADQDRLLTAVQSDAKQSAAALAKAEKHLADLTNQNNHLVKQLQSVKDNNGDLQTTTKVNAGEKAAITRELEALKEQLKTDQAKAASNVAKLRAENEKLERQQAATQEKHNAMQRRSEAQATELQMAKTEQGKAQANLSGELKTAKVAVDSAQKQIADINKHKEGLLAEIGQFKEQANELKTTAKLEAVDKAAMTRDLQAIKDQHTSAINAHNNHVADLKAELAARQQSLARSEKVAKKFRDSLASLKSNKDSIASEDSKRIADLDKLLAAEITEKRRLASDLKNTEKELGAALADIKELKSDGKHLSASAKQHETKSEKLDRAYAELKKDLEKSTQAEQHYRNDARSTSNENKELKNKLEAREKELNALTGKIPTLEAELRGKDKNETRLENQIAELKGELSSVNNKMGSLRSDLSSRDTANVGLQGSIDSLNSQLADYQAHEGDLLERINLLESQLITARKDASKTLMARILELEAMLKAERSKVEEFHTMPSISEVTTSSNVKTVAANTDIRRKNKTS